MSFEVFICYKRLSGKDFAEALKKSLEESGLHAFLDIQDIPAKFKGTDEWENARNAAIVECRVFALILTSGFDLSTEIKKELKLARESVHKEFVYFRHKELKPNLRIVLNDEELDLGKQQQVSFENESDLVRKAHSIIVERQDIVAFLKETENPSEKYKAKALPLVFLTLFLMFFLPFQLATFWILGQGFGINNWFNFENLVFVFFFAIVSGICMYFFENSFSNLLLRLVRKWTLPYFLFYFVFVLSISGLNLAIFLYPQTTGKFFQSYWLDFLQLSIVLLFFTFIAMFLSHFPLTQYYSALKDEKYMPNPKGEVKDFIQNFSRSIPKLRKRLPAFLILLIFAFSAVIVPLDVYFGLFTPSYQINGETFSHAYPYTSDTLYLFIYSTRMSPQNVTSENMFYRLAQTQYTIYPAKLPLSNLISIPNPTNITSSGTGQPFLPTSEMANPNLGSLYLNVSKKIGYTFVPENYNFTCINFNVTGYKEPITANLTYWKLVNPNVALTTLKPEYTNLGNDTWLESYTYMISNNEKLPLSISGLEFDRFNYQVVNATSTRLYLNGNEMPYANFVYTNIMLGTVLPFFTGNQVNVTVTFQSTDIS